MGCAQSTLPWQDAFHRVVPLVGAKARRAGVVGTIALDLVINPNFCCLGPFYGSDIWCFFYRGQFRVPWPCHCCGAECCCCPHLPHSPAFDQAMTRGLRELIAEAGQLAVAEAALPQHLDAARAAFQSEVPQMHYVLGLARDMLLKQRWTPRANALLASLGLRVAVFNWVEDQRDDKGNKIGELLRSALQFYELQGGSRLARWMPVDPSNYAESGTWLPTDDAAAAAQSPLEAEVTALFAQKAREDAERGAAKL